MELFLFLSQPEIVDRMIIINDYGKLAALDGIVNELEKLFYQIQFTVELGEDKTQLQDEYNRILLEYNNNKD